MIPESIKSFKVEITVTGENGESHQALLVEAEHTPGTINTDCTIGGGVPGAKVVNNILIATLTSVREAAGLRRKDDGQHEGGTD